MIHWRSCRHATDLPATEELERAHRDWAAYTERRATFTVNDGTGDRQVCPSCYCRHVTDQSVRLSVVAATWQARRRWATMARKDARRAAACESVERCACTPPRRYITGVTPST